MVMEAKISVRRLNNEFEQSVQDTDFLSSVNIIEGDIGKWQVRFKDECMPDFLRHLVICMKFPIDYPFKPPQISIPNIFHPNVYSTGSLCISILEERSKLLPGSEDLKFSCWRPSLSVLNVLIGVKSVLEDPNTDSPANIAASKLYLRYLEY